jgi:alkylation response protein AidB-like acyl-CoA dehydrogenase
MGTSELTTAEITFNGAVAYQVGPLERGVANVVGIVLTYSRLTVGLSAAASMTRAAREAKAYAGFRQAFGVNIDSFPMVKNQLDTLECYAKRTTAGAFRIYRDFLGLPDGLKGGLLSDEPEAIRKKRFLIRELIMLQKITASYDATDMLRLAMSIFGGHGIMEDFSSLPRLFRDAAINELWEGPRNVLLAQIHRDINKASSWYSPLDIVRDMLKGSDDEIVDSFAARMNELAGADLFFSGHDSAVACEKWDAFCHELFHVYQDNALKEVGSI